MRPLKRRDFLRLSALTAVGSFAVACQKPAAPTPVPTVIQAEVVEVKPTDTPAAAPAGKGRVVIGIGTTDVQTWEALKAAYEKLHPEITIDLQLRPGEEGYEEWVRAQFATGEPDVSLFASSHLQDLDREGKLLNFYPYLQGDNPYTGKKWMDSFLPAFRESLVDPVTKTKYRIDLESVQTCIFCNKRIFSEAGIDYDTIDAHPSMDTFLGWCEKIKAAGYIPLAEEGTARQIWTGGGHPWVIRSWTDQYTRQYINTSRAQQGDWCWRDGVDDTWTYDPKDPTNDDTSFVSLNIVRLLRALRDGDIRFDGPEQTDMWTRVYQLFGPDKGYLPEGWLGSEDVYPLFLTQKTAMQLDNFGRLITQFNKDIRNLAEGAYGVKEGEAKPTLVPGAQEAVVFSLGSFNFPSMDESPYVEARNRANELPVNAFRIPKKSRKQNDIEMDFLMWLISPAGAPVYVANKLDPDNSQGGIAGPLIIEGVELPSEWQEQFDPQRQKGAQSIGNYDKVNCLGDFLARGGFKFDPAIRDWAALVQELYRGGMTVEDFCARNQKLTMETHWQGILDQLGITAEDLDHPEKQPPGYLGGSQM
jgi:ABC-type glycerol-3-phosphate transport system substrate-binding protein